MPAVVTAPPAPPGVVAAVPILQENANVIIARAVHRDHVTRPVAACATRAAKRDKEVERSEAEGSPPQPLLVPTNRIFLHNPSLSPPTTSSFTTPPCPHQPHLRSTAPPLHPASPPGQSWSGPGRRTGRRQRVARRQSGQPQSRLQGARCVRIPSKHTRGRAVGPGGRWGLELEGRQGG
eukprot:scaffold4261_cov110-Isochrysis_galbana.AAC.6